MHPHHSSRLNRWTRATALLACAVVASACATGDRGASKSRHGRKGTFEATHEFVIDVPAEAGSLRAWMAMPSDKDTDQKVVAWSVDAPLPTRIVRDARGNRFLLLEAASPPAGPLTVTTNFTLERWEVTASVDPSMTRAHTEAELAQLADDLAPSSRSVIDDDVRAMARAAVGDETNPIVASRAIYDAILDHVEYHVKDPKPNAEKSMNASGTGSSRYTFDQCTGNCTDIHALYAAVSRAAGIPTRAVYGSFFKGPLDGEDQDQSYHCWIEFHAPGLGWIPLDVAVADIFVADFEANEHSRPRANLTVANGYGGPDPALVEYYFGNLDERRVVWHRYRDLRMVDPAQLGDPLLWNPKAYVEADGKSIAVTRKLTYREATPN